ncbi:MAG: NADH-quinone oxidoreductase subunit J [Chitinophagales bacterium]|nr:NADH-quinone oxidoreductase subunit J [Chitinophagales bacterium]MDW8428218.1 NADH-quinone oxidoreductase subunit J [Chitinophagales bacterium]
MLALTFYTLAAATIALALMVILARNPVHSVLFLVLVFFGISAIYLLLLDASFVGVVNIIVYAGAIMVLFLYVIMLMNLNETGEPRPSRMHLVGIAAIAGLFLLTLTSTATHFLPAQTSDLQQAVPIGTARALGQVLFTQYILPFEVASILFLVAIIGAVVLGRKDVALAQAEAVKHHTSNT